MVYYPSHHSFIRSCFFQTLQKNEGSRGRTRRINWNMEELLPALIGTDKYLLYVSKTQQWPQDYKRFVFITIPKKGNAKECSNYRTIALISHASKVMLKTLQVRLQQYVNCELPDMQARFKMGEEPEIQLPTSVGSSKSKRVPEQHLLLLYWLCQSLWLCGSH